MLTKSAPNSHSTSSCAGEVGLLRLDLERHRQLQVARLRVGGEGLGTASLRLFGLGVRSVQLCCVSNRPARSHQHVSVMRWTRIVVASSASN